MNTSNITEFLNRPETDDTLQNIRKEYLASKKNLKDLLNSSPASGPRPQQQQQQQEQRLPTPPSLTISSKEDERLRQQLRDALNNEPKPQRLQPPLASLNEIAYLRKIVHEQQAQLQSLTQELHNQKSFNYSLQSRLLMVEDYVKHLESTVTSGNNHSLRTRINPSSLSAPSSSSTSELFTRSTKVDLDNTKVLLGLEDVKPERRQFSNLDDNTARLLQLSGTNNRTW